MIIFLNGVAAKEITGLCGKVLVAKDTYMISRVVDNRCPQTSSTCFSGYAETGNISVVA